MQIDEKTLRELRKKIDIEINKKEIEIIQHWMREIEAIYKKRYENMGSMQVELKSLLERMNNRITMLNILIKESR
ncbi:MAG TPA: hypothetical protein PK864_06860 [Syntrophorhabdaceae bacterium]|nr:hypothetical protein [Syntrophorhabdaceae bacterium]HOL05293.1 hypothetical protein [Syntrophorhabdaceae bacterium]HON85732.1 hypothetical protein [Syntrophorhabdaceae bacterium]HOT42094.1 hypothetical protein [Syntrophorhabdaceae bacterium]HPC66035.1 hypothetical protein [Syntrophorhabdaceae bacterium]